MAKFIGTFLLLGCLTPGILCDLDRRIPTYLRKSFKDLKPPSHIKTLFKPTLRYFAQHTTNTTINDVAGLPWYCFTSTDEVDCLPLFEMPEHFRFGFDNLVAEFGEKLHHGIHDHQEEETKLENSQNTEAKIVQESEKNRAETSTETVTQDSDGEEIEQPVGNGSEVVVKPDDTEPELPRNVDEEISADIRLETPGINPEILTEENNENNFDIEPETQSNENGEISLDIESGIPTLNLNRLENEAIGDGFFKPATENTKSNEQTPAYSIDDKIPFKAAANQDYEEFDFTEAPEIYEYEGSPRFFSNNDFGASEGLNDFTISKTTLILKDKENQISSGITVSKEGKTTTTQSSNIEVEEANTESNFEFNDFNFVLPIFNVDEEKKYRKYGNDESIEDTTEVLSREDKAILNKIQGLLKNFGFTIQE